MAENNQLKKTLNLPQTNFSMKAKLPVKEPEIMVKWMEIKLYDKILEARKNAPVFVLHDGPPYANGNIHLGTALNKILKDFIIKTKSLQGYRAPYLPGWDCHGLPIEIKVDQQLGEKKKKLSQLKIREECRKYAEKYVVIQREQFRRLGVFGEWDKPYLTMDPVYEGDILRFLAAFFRRQNIYKGKKPVYWCIHCQTALAEAEIEYKPHTSPSVYVKFPLISDLSRKYPELKGRKIDVLIWTTTPWTLPANLALACHPDYEYSIFEADGETYIVAKRLIPLLTEEIGWKKTRVLVTFQGKELEGLKAKHSFYDRESVFVLADYVTFDQGTGCVHTAPGHGHEDYATGVKYGLEIYTPVDAKGKFTSQVEKYAGLNVFQANRIITEDMKKEGVLLKEENFTHSYPHCWRCKNPVIFRATAQWFISMDTDKLRDRVLEEVKKVKWIPSWGEERIANMIEARPDWCISRQRTWGVPIPAFFCQKCGTILADEKVTLYVADIFSKKGSNSWFTKEPIELLPPGTKCSQCNSQEFSKENNILDVWFESGVSHSVLGKREDLPWPADIYIEGHDQYRGWFNSSLVVGVAAKGASPYRMCITHGFVLDEEGRAMSKSMGNYIEPSQIIEQNGAEILRLWAAMLNYKEDARFGQETLQRLIEAYRKIRNTWRFLLGNLYDFSPDEDMLPIKEMEPLDRWILEQEARVGTKVLNAYTNYEYHVVFRSLFNFFTVDLSAFYLDVCKDRLYCSGKKSKLRKSAQTAIFYLLKNTLILMAPILPFTTEEAWESMPVFEGKSESVHLQVFPDFKDCRMEKEEASHWDKLLEIREKVLKTLEEARENKQIGNSLEAEVILIIPPQEDEFFQKYQSLLAELFITSKVSLQRGKESHFEVKVVEASGEKCQRCWNFSTYVGKNSRYPNLCPRCEEVVSGMDS
ncbi:MAG: isoleucine--tRNA ligase [Acidobacteriota bacterium]